MEKIVIAGDIHEGINFGYRIDPESGLSERALDIHRNFARAAEYAIEANAALFIIAGDLFDRTHISPAFRELVRRDVIEPLGRNNIKIWILAGNHDQPRNDKRGTSIEDFRGYPHVKIFRRPSIEIAEIDSTRTGFIILPYMHPEQIAELVREKTTLEISQEQLISAGQELLKEWLRKKAQELNSYEHKIMLAHYYIEGAKLRETAYPEVLPGEFSLRRDMIPSNLDLAVFGHVHLHQSMGRQGSTEIIYTGAVERIDWGERGDKKGFIAIDTSTWKWEFKSLPAREMLKIEVEVKPGEDPTQVILNAIPEVKDKLVRLEVLLSEGQRQKIIDRRIEEKLQSAFHSELKYAERSSAKTGFAEFTLNPYELLSKFINTNYSSHPKKEALLEEGMKALMEVLK
ncbi:MAG: metallophosphoesterase [Halobacteria archaeon]